MALRNLSKLIKLAAINSVKNEDDSIVLNPDGTALSVFNAPIIRALSQGLGVMLKVIIAEDDVFGVKKPDGSWTGIMGMLVRNEADISSSGITITNERAEVVNFTFPLHVTDFTFITNKPEPYPRKFAMFKVFFIEVWICIGLCLFMISFFLCNLLKKKMAFSKVLIAAIGNLVEQSFSLEVRQRNTVCLLLTWFLGITILSNSYKAVILSVITFPRMVGIRDISDLSKAAKDNSFRCISYKGAVSSVEWFESTDNRLKSIGECLRRSEMDNLYDSDAFQEYPHKKAFLADRIDILQSDREYFISNDAFSSSFIGIAYTRNFCCPRKLESVVHHITEAGLFQKYLADRVFLTQLRRHSNQSIVYHNTIVSSLSLKDFTGAFLVLAVGYLVSFVTFVLEIMRKRMKSFFSKIVLKR